MSIKAQNKKVLIKICEDQTIDLTLMMDRVRIQQILINLLDNAIKFAHIRSNIELIVKV
jgi:signal transduction histidine kinase